MVHFIKVEFEYEGKWEFIKKDFMIFDKYGYNLKIHKLWDKSKCSKNNNCKYRIIFTSEIDADYFMSFVKSRQDMAFKLFSPTANNVIIFPNHYIRAHMKIISRM